MLETNANTWSAAKAASGSKTTLFLVPKSPRFNQTDTVMQARCRMTPQQPLPS